MLKVIVNQIYLIDNWQTLIFFKITTNMLKRYGIIIV